MRGRYTLQRPYFGIIGRMAPVFLVNGNHEPAARDLLDGTPNKVAVDQKFFGTDKRAGLWSVTHWRCAVFVAETDA